VDNSASLATSFREDGLSLTSTEFTEIEALFVKLAQNASKLSEELKALHRRRSAQVNANAKRLLSMIETTQSHLNSGKKLNRLVFSRNIRLLFRGPIESDMDSTANKAKKRITRDRCQKILSFGPKGIIVWAASITPSLWEGNTLNKDTFDCIIEFFKPALHTLPAEICEVLSIIGSEEPLQSSCEYQAFLQEAQKDNEHSTGQTQLQNSPNHDQDTTPEVDEAAQNALEAAFLVPRDKLLELLELRNAGHSDILTIPVQRRVASAVISIPREAAIRFGYSAQLPMIFRSQSISE